MKYKVLEKLYYSKNGQYQAEYEKRYNGSSTVRIDFKIHNNPAFFVQSAEVLDLLTSILRNDKAIMKLCNTLPGVALSQYSRKCMINEIVLTNKIEGVHSSRKEIGDVLAVLEQQSSEKGKKKRFFGIVNKYSKLSDMETIPLASAKDIRALYDEIVLDEVLADNKKNVPDGQIFRADSVIVQNGNDIVHIGLMPESTIIEYIDKALSFLNDSRIEELYRICLFHYMFGYIHPFYDGNGRLSRFILSYCISRSLEYVIAYRLSGTIKENLKQYYKAFEVCNIEKNRGDLTPFLIMMLTMINRAQVDLINALNQRLEQWTHYEAMHRKKYSSLDAPLLGYLIQAALFSEYGISTKQLLELCGISSGTLKNRMDRIRNADLLTEKRIGKEKYYKINLQILDE